MKAICGHTRKRKRSLFFCALFVLGTLSLFADTNDQVQELMSRAQAAQRSSQYDEASAAYREVIKLKPGWAPAEFNLGMMYFLQKDYAKALDLFTASLQHQQPVAAAYMFRGIAYFNTGQNEKALTSLLKYRELRPDDTQVHTFLAGTYFSLGDYHHAASEYLRQIELTPAEETSYYRLGECFLSLAKEELKTLNDVAQGKYFIWLIAAEAHGHDGGYTAAKPYLAKALDLNSSSPEAFIIQGQIQLSGQLASEAKQSFAEALKRDARSCRASEGMFESELALGEIDQAVALLTEANRAGNRCRSGLLVPNLGLATNEYVERIRALKERAQAGSSKQLVDLEMVDLEGTKGAASKDRRCGWSLSAKSQSVDPILVRASCLEQQGNLRDSSEVVLSIPPREHVDPEVAYRIFGLYMRLAAGSMTRLAELSPDSAYLTFMSAQVMEQQGKVQEAEAEYLKAISRPDAGSDVLVAYARLICTQNRFDEAIPVLNKALAIDPLDQSANALLGQVYFEQNRSAEAIKPLQEAVRLAPSEEQPRVDLANSLRRLGRISEAIATLEAATSDPSGRMHYVLSQCYRDMGRTEEAKQALQIYRERNSSPGASAK